MGIFNGLINLMSPRATEEKAVTSHDLLEEIYGGWESETGLTITWRQAIQISAVLACIRVLANGVSQVPFTLYRKDGRFKERATKHPLYDLVHTAPNEHMTSFDFRFMLMLHMALTGNAFAYINRVRGEVVELLPFTPANVMIKRNGWDVHYIVNGEEGRQYTVSSRDMWHLRYMPWDGISGLDTVKLARDVLGLTKAAEIYGSKFYKNGGRPSGVLSTPAVLNEENRKGLRADWEAMNAGLQNAGRTAVIWGDLKYTPLTGTNDQNQFLETRRFQIEEVCRILGVFPLMVYYSDKASTYASAEQMFTQHVTHTLDPLYVNIEQSAALKLLTKEERQDGYYFKLISNGLMRGVAKDRGEFYKSMRTVGAMTINEVRDLEEMNPIEGGDDPFVPLNSNVSNAAQKESSGGTEGASNGNEKSV